MSDIVYIIAVLVVAIGGLGGVAHLLEKRRRNSGAIGIELPKLGPTGRILLWIIRALVVVMVLSAIGTFAFGVPSLIWVAAGGLILYLIIGRVYQVVRLAGK